MAQQRPNLLFIMADSLRADCLGAVQAGIEVVPKLNRLASQSCSFTRAYATAPLCVPARTALFTGKYPIRTEVVYNDFQGETAQDHKTFQQYLAEAGYDVAHVGVDHVKVKPSYRERVPFALWVSESEHRQYLAEHVPEEAGVDLDPFRREILELRGSERVPTKYTNTRTAVWPYPVEHFQANYWSRRAVEFLKGPRERPFALFLFLYAPHPPFRVPEPYASMFDPDRLDLPQNVGQVPQGEPANRRQGIAGQLGEGVTMEQWRKAWAAYLGLASLADAAIGKALDALDALPYCDHTIVVYTGDHGEFMGQRQMFQKFELYEPIVHVPMSIRVPGAEPRSFDAPVSHLDLMPTLFELMGLSMPEGLDGISLADSVARGTLPPSRPVFSQFSGCYGKGPVRRAVITHRSKYVYDPHDIPELYDLQEDPLEMNNLASDPRRADTVRELHALCKAWAERCGDWVEF